MEACLVAAVLALLCGAPGLTATLRGASVVQRIAFAGVAAAMVAGHFHAKMHDSFPFVAWDIYTEVPSGEPRVFDYYAIRRDATQEQLIPAELFPALAKKIATQLEQVAAAMEGSSDPARRDQLARQYDGLLLALAREYNRRHADNPLRAIRIEEWTIPVARYAGRESIVRQPFRTWTLKDESQ